MSEQKVPSREELAATVASLLEKMQAMEAALAAKPEPTSGEQLMQARRLAEAEAELEALRPRRLTGRPNGPQPKYVPYKGLVRAKEDCAVGTFRSGPHPDQGKPYGDVFEVDVAVLWSDDPYEPVNIVSYREDNSPIVERRTDVPVIDARWRIKTDPESRDPIARAV